MIFLGSRYQDTAVEYLLDSRTEKTRPTVMRSNAEIGQTGTVVTYWPGGARLDLAGSNLFNDPEKWWRILDQNTDILNPMSIHPGVQVRLP